MGKVVISPDVKKETVRIDMYGNEIDPITKRLIKPVERPYIPSPEEMANVAKPKESKEPKTELKTDALGDKIEKMIEDKVNKLIEDKINKALEKLL